MQNKATPKECSEINRIQGLPNCLLENVAVRRPDFVNISEELRLVLLKRGASVVGLADLSQVDSRSRLGYQWGVAIGIALNPKVLEGIANGPTVEYYQEYSELNLRLDSLDEFAAEMLRYKGYSARALVRDSVTVDTRTRRTTLPYKTVATCAGLGWIGKSAMLVNEEFGCALRISAVLTNAPLTAAKPINSSRCGSCTACREHCPALAVSGRNWNVETDRDEFFNAFGCRRTAHQLSAEIGIEESLCGLCILHCPWTQRYLKRNADTPAGVLI